MEEIEPRKETVAFAVTLVWMLLLIAGLATILAITITQAADAPQPAKGGLARLAVISLALLVMAVMMLLWVIMRRVRRPLMRKTEHNTPYVDAWAEAGRRVKPEPQTPDDES